MCKAHGVAVLSTADAISHGLTAVYVGSPRDYIRTESDRMPVPRCIEHADTESINPVQRQRLVRARYRDYDSKSLANGGVDLDHRWQCCPTHQPLSSHPMLNKYQDTSSTAIFRTSSSRTLL